MSDRDLLHRYRDTGSDAAFEALVRRHAGLVLAVAARRTGNRAAAEEVAQNVFLVLAAKAGKLNGGGALVGWLHRTTLLEAANVARREHTRRRKMEELAEMTRRDQETEPETLDTPALDEAINELGDSDRRAVLLRYYEGRSFREVGEALNKSEAAARQQVGRALDKLSSHLRRRGITTTAALVGGGLAGQLTASVPPAVATAFARAALAGASEVGPTTLILNQIHTMAYAKTKTAAAVALLAAIPLGVQWNENRALRKALAGDKGAPAARAGGVLAGNATGPASKGDAAGGREGARPEAHVGPVASRGSRAWEWEQALYEQDPVRRSQRLAALLAQLDASNAASVADLFFEKNGHTRFATEANLFLRAWGKLDGTAAVDYLATNAKDGWSSPAMLAALGGWASASPAEARHWAESVKEERLRENLLFGVIDGWSLVDFKAAATYAETRPRSEARTRFIDLLLKRSMADGDLGGAQDWFAGIANNDHNEIYKRRAFEKIVETMLLRDPSAAADWISSQSDGPYVSHAAIHNTVSRLAESSPQDALRWIASMDELDPEVGAHGASYALERWARTDPDASGTWLGANMDHPAFGPMAQMYSQAVMEMDYEAARQWAESIEEQDYRDRAMVGLARFQLGNGGTVEDLRSSGFTEDQIASTQRAVIWHNSEQQINLTTRFVEVGQSFDQSRSVFTYSPVVAEVGPFSSTGSAGGLRLLNDLPAEEDRAPWNQEYLFLQDTGGGESPVETRVRLQAVQDQLVEALEVAEQAGTPEVRIEGPPSGR